MSENLVKDEHSDDGKVQQIQTHDLHSFDLKKLTDLLEYTEHEINIEDPPLPSPVIHLMTLGWTSKMVLLHHFDESLDVMIFLRSM